MNVTFKKYEDIYDQVKRVYQEHKERILRVLPFVDIQHIGSSVIPRSITKGGVDLNVRVEIGKFDEVVGELKKRYEINQPENWTNAFASFKDDSREVSVGVQVTIIR